MDKEQVYFIEQFNSVGENKPAHGFCWPIETLEDRLYTTMVTGLYTQCIFKIKLKPCKSTSEEKR